MEKLELPNGLTVLLESRPYLHSVAAVVGVRYGSNHDPADKLGTAHFIEHMLSGTKGRSGKRPTDKIEGAGGYHNGFTLHEATLYYIDAPASELKTALDTLADIVFNPRFDRFELEREKGVVLNEIGDAESDADRYIGNLFLKILYKRHPIRRKSLGNYETLSRLTIDDIVDSYRKNYLPSNIVLSLVSNQPPEEISTYVKKVFGIKRSGTTPARRNIKEREYTPGRVELERPEIEQTRLIYGFRTANLRHTDSPTLDMLRNVLGKRLFREFREKRGLAYRIGVEHTQYTDCGYFACIVSTKPENQKDVERILQKELRKLGTIKANELEATRKPIHGIHQKSKDDIEVVVTRAVTNEIGYGDHSYADKYIARIETLTTKDLAAAAKKYLDPDRATVVVLKPKPKKPKLK